MPAEPHTKRLSLIRHGRSAYVHPGGLLNRMDMLAWRRGYDAAGILANDRPPRGLDALVATADLIVASDFPRAMMTADRLSDGRPVKTSPLLREAPADLPQWNRIRMPRAFWEWTTTVDWGIRIMRGTDIPPHDRDRASKAAFWLDDLSREYEHIAVFTHGVFRRILARQLEAIQWRPSGRRRSYDHWSVWALTHE